MGKTSFKFVIEHLKYNSFLRHENTEDATYQNMDKDGQLFN